MHDNSGYLAQNFGQQRLTYHLQLPLHPVVTHRRHNNHVTSNNAKTGAHTGNKEGRSANHNKHYIDLKPLNSRESSHFAVTPDSHESDVISNALDTDTGHAEFSRFLAGHVPRDEAALHRKRSKVRRSNGSASGLAGYRASGKGERYRSVSESGHPRQPLLRKDGKL